MTHISIRALISLDRYILKTNADEKVEEQDRYRQQTG